jgi:NADPH oxidase 1
LTSFSNPKNFDRLNDALIKKHFDHTPTYMELLFKSIPGLTGVILMVVIAIMFFTSLDFMRRRYFQLFSYVHVLLFPIFLIASFVHGADGWVNFGFPTSVFFLPIPMLIYFFMIFRRIIRMKTKPFYVADASFSNGYNFMFLNLVKPKGYDFKPGQYAFINIPEISYFQWHPFSIASSPNNDFMVFMVQNSGDWTAELLKYMHNIKKKTFDEACKGAVGPKYHQALQDYMISMKI